MQKKKRNSLAGKHPSYTSRGMTAAQIKAKRAYDKQYSKSPARVAYRTQLNKANRNNPNSKVGDKKDMSHTKKGNLVLESQSKNRARNRGKK